MNYRLVLSQRKLRVINGVNAVKPKFTEVNMVIPSQAPEGFGSGEGVETSSLSPNNNASLERPGACVTQVQDIVRPTRKQWTRQSMEPAKEAPEIGSRRSTLGLLSVRTEMQNGVNCWNAKAESGYANQQPSGPNGNNVGPKVQRLAVEEPTNKTAQAPRISYRDEDIVQAFAKAEEQPATATLQRPLRNGCGVSA